jgi:hypothetical protein
MAYAKTYVMPCGRVKVGGRSQRVVPGKVRRMLFVADHKGAKNWPKGRPKNDQTAFLGGLLGVFSEKAVLHGQLIGSATLIAPHQP